MRRQKAVMVAFVLLTMVSGSISIAAPALYAQQQAQDDCEKKARQIEEDAQKKYDEAMRQARVLLKAAEGMVHEWWEGFIPIWGLEVVVDHAWGALAAQTAQTMMKVARTDLDTAKTKANQIRKDCAGKHSRSDDGPKQEKGQEGQQRQKP